MTLREAIIEAINANFQHICVERNAQSICEAFNKKVKDSDNMHVFPIAEKIELNPIDDFHDKLSIIYDDYKIDGVITWKRSIYLKEHFILMNVE